MKNIIRCVVVFIIVVSASAREYIYPIGTSSLSSEPSFMYVIHQKTVDDVQLFAWDPSTGIAYPLLNALYLPYSVSIFPDNSGFSFIDKGRIRIKKFNRRSPKTVDLYDSVYDVAGVQWIDQYNGYFYGKKRDTYGIFHLSCEGDLYTIVLNNRYDCMYPQKINASLFYIQRNPLASGEYNYSIVKGDYPPQRFNGKALFNETEHFCERVRGLIEAEEHTVHSEECVEHNASVIVDCGNRAIAFLSMLDENHGFFVEHNLYTRHQLAHITCVYHEIVCKDGVWSMTPLFTYQLPTNLLFDTVDRLLETRTILVPYHHNNIIYFSDCLGKADSLYNFQYTHEYGVTNVPFPISQASQLSFAPIFFKGGLFYGGMCDEGIRPYQWEVEEGNTFLDLLAV